MVRVLILIGPIDQVEQQRRFRGNVPYAMENAWWDDHQRRPQSAEAKLVDSSVGGRVLAPVEKNDLQHPMASEQPVCSELVDVPGRNASGVHDALKNLVDVAVIQHPLTPEDFAQNVAAVLDHVLHLPDAHSFNRVLQGIPIGSDTLPVFLSTKAVRNQHS